MTPTFLAIMTRSAIAVALAIAIFAATPARSLTWTYDLENFIGDTGVSEDLGLGPGSWGLAIYPRKPNGALLFSFEDVTLIYDDEAAAARIEGAMTELFSGADAFVNYSLSHLTNVGPGQFIDTIGTGIGTLSWGNQIRSIGHAGMNGFFFAHTCDGHRLPGDTTTCGGHGWIGEGGVQDFIYTARLETPPPPSAVPLPAGWIALLSALAGLSAWRRMAAA